MKTRRSDVPYSLTRLSKIRNIVVLAFFAATALIAASATPNFRTLIDFNSTNGANPNYESLVQGFDGNYYGTTVNGGTYDAGTVFKITPSGTLTTIYSFCSVDSCTDGESPTGALVQGTDGNFYGTTAIGGGNPEFCGQDYGCGTVFEITPGGKLSTLYSFCAHTGCLDGYNPLWGLVRASDGNLYGTTTFGGGNTEFCGEEYGCGTVFEITPARKLTTLYRFCAQANCVDGGYPTRLIQANNGNFYGTTQYGGPNDGPNGACSVGVLNGCGTLFEMTSAGELTTIYDFCAQTNCSDGAIPSGNVVQASNGNFYGATQIGGNAPPYSYGTVFEITPGGVLTTLHSFDGTDGAAPHGWLIQGTDSYLYGTTSGVGDSDGTVFRITSSGALTTLHSFVYAEEGNPYGGLVQGTDGKFYGTTYGTFDTTVLKFGSVFSLSMGLRSFVETVPTSGKVGTAVMILGNNLEGATSVTFNSTAATFKVVGSSAIETIVPAGATSGRVDVTTPTEKLQSNVSFVVK
jgi:uncharacterized repeat protein (TIGR03803 family)